MPYINPKLRPKYDKVLNEMPDIDTKGDLEYCIFKLMKQYMKTKEWKYSNLHDTTYAAHHCGDEYRRRFLDDRENRAMCDNGDVQ